MKKAKEEDKVSRRSSDQCTDYSSKSQKTETNTNRTVTVNEQ